MTGSLNTTGGTAAEVASRGLMATPVEGCLGAYVTAESTVPHEVAQAGYVTVVVRDDTNRVLARAQGHYVLPALGAVVDRSTDGAVAELGRPVALLAALGPAGSDPANWTVRSTAALANPRGQVHGGILLAMGQLAQLRVQAPDLERVSN